MTVLVSAASKHGSTAEIATAVARVLSERGPAVDVRPVENVTMVEGYDAVVLGSAVYGGHGMESARRLAEAQAGALSTRPVWLFSSGPVGDPPKPEEDPVDVAEIVAATGARDHRVFAGKLVRKQLRFGDKAIAVALRVPDGDFRDWTEIRGWAAGIADALRSEA